MKFLFLGTIVAVMMWIPQSAMGDTTAKGFLRASTNLNRAHQDDHGKDESPQKRRSAEDLNRLLENLKPADPSNKPVPRDLYYDPATGLSYITDPVSGVPDGNAATNLFTLVPHGDGHRFLEIEEEDSEKHEYLQTADTILPTISSISPTNNTIVPNAFEVRATVSDNVKVSKVTIELVLVSSGASTTLSLSRQGNDVWVSEKLGILGTNTFRLTVTATDFSGNMRTSAPVFFTSKPAAVHGAASVAKGQLTSNPAPIFPSTGRV